MKKINDCNFSDRSYPCKISKVQSVFSSLKITAGINVPEVGIFWIIDDEIVVISEGVDKNYNPLAHEDVLHIEVWKTIKNRYKVDGKAVKYDYFPRGRVMIYPIKDKSGVFQYFECDVYGDKCIINDADVREMIEDKFRLYLNTCKVSYKGQLSVDGTHYTCHNCRAN